MAKTKTKASATRASGRARGDVLRQALAAARLLAEKPWGPRDLAAELDCTRRTVERILRTFEAEGLDVRVETEGSDARLRFYWLEPAEEWRAALAKRRAR